MNGEYHSEFMKLYYDTGELKAEGECRAKSIKGSTQYFLNGDGIVYHKNGRIFQKGLFVDGMIVEGKDYYPSGKLRFEGIFNNKQLEYKLTGNTYYGPSYPVCGKFFLEDETLAYDGYFKVEKRGSIGYPTVVFPLNYGSLTND